MQEDMSLPFNVKYRRKRRVASDKSISNEVKITFSEFNHKVIISEAAKEIIYGVIFDSLIPFDLITMMTITLFRVPKTSRKMQMYRATAYNVGSNDIVNANRIF